MGVDLRLYIPPHVHTEDIMSVVKRYNRDPDLIKKGLNSPNCNTDKPSHSGNSWYFAEKEQKGVSVVELMPSMIMCKYKFLGIEDRMFYLHYENHSYKKEVLGHKLMSARSTPIQIATATCLVKVFGGHLSYADSSDHYDVVVPDKEALYNSKNYITDDADVHFYKIINFIDKLAPVTSIELVKANSNSAYQYEDNELAEHSAKIDELISKTEKALISKEIKPIDDNANIASNASNTGRKPVKAKKIKI